MEGVSCWTRTKVHLAHYSLPVHGSRQCSRDHPASHSLFISYSQASIIMTRHQLEMLDDDSMPILFFYLFIELLPSLTSFFLNLLTIAFTTACGREFQTLITCCEKRYCLLAVSDAQLVSLWHLRSSIVRSDKYQLRIHLSHCLYDFISLDHISSQPSPLQVEEPQPF